MYVNLVRSGGLVALHDIVHHPHVPTCEVDRFWNGIKGQFEHEEYVEHGGWGGIGVLHIGDEAPGPVGAVD